MPDQERLDIISRAIAGLLRRQEAIEERLARIEQALGLEKPLEPIPPRAADPTPAPVVLPGPLPESLPKPQPIPLDPPDPDVPPAPPVTPAARPSGRFETEMGLRWVNRIGAFTLVLAAGFFFKLAVDNDWIGPAGRVLLGVLAGFVTLGAADLLWRRGHRIYAHGVSGMGIAILYLAFYASIGFYQLLPRRWRFC